MIYKKRWQIELLFKQLKQNFPLKYFLGDNENAIEIQIWTAMLANLLITLAKSKVKRKWAFSNLVSVVRLQLMNYTFNRTLDTAGVFANEGKMVDASFVETPRQRNTREENKHIKQTGTAPETWKEKPHKLSQKDTDARWTKKKNAVFYGYKNHIKSDTKTKFIEKFEVTDASVHDSQPVEKLLEGKDAGQPFYAGSAYTGQEEEKIYEKKKVVNMVNEKGVRSKPLQMYKRQTTRRNRKPGQGWNIFSVFCKTA